MHSKENHHFYGRRKGKTLKAGRVSAVEEIAQKYMLPETILDQESIDPQQIFPNKKIWLEVGFGTGEHLTGQAMKNSDIGFIGFEPFMNGVAAAAKDMVENNIDNIRLWPDDALPIMAKLPDASVDRFYLLFNDPWPKTRHYKRRFIQPHTIEVLARIMKPGMQLRLATDDKSLAEWMLLHLVQSPHFTWDNWQNAEWSTMPDDWIETRYQQKAAQQGRLARYINFTRV